jgi:hypothetical protein
VLLYLLALAVIGIGGGVAVARFLRDPETTRRLRAAPKALIAEAAESADVKIRGTVEVFEETVTGPLSGRTCVFFFSRTFEDGLEIRRQIGGVPFIVRDQTGRALVDPTGAAASLRDDYESLAYGPRDQLEAVIEPGDEVEVTGRGVREPDPGAVADTDGYRGGAPTRLRLSASPRFPLRIVDASLIGKL